MELASSLKCRINFGRISIRRIVWCSPINNILLIIKAIKAIKFTIFIYLFIFLNTDQLFVVRYMLKYFYFLFKRFLILRCNLQLLIRSCIFISILFQKGIFIIYRKFTKSKNPLPLIIKAIRSKISKSNRTLFKPMTGVQYWDIKSK